jgi:hypothetical protein
MAGAAYSLTPTDVPHVETKYRRIVTEIPPRGAVEKIEKLRAVEPVSMTGQPPVLWDHAEGLCVFDEWGNQWLDWSSGVLVASAGHSRPEIVQAVVEQAQKNLLHNYCFPSDIRRRLVEKIAEIAPAPLKKVFLLTTGSEAVLRADAKFLHRTIPKRRTGRRGKGRRRSGKRGRNAMRDNGRVGLPSRPARPPTPLHRTV